jgi:hypothetical protein
VNHGRYIPDAEFAPAPLGTRGRITTSIIAATVLLALALAAVLSLAKRPTLPWQGFITFGIALPVYAAVWYGTRVRRYRLTEDELLVERAFRTVRLPLAGLKEATHDRDAMRGAWKIRGNDGVGAISGRFWSKRLGRFNAYLSDGEHAVVLRWPDRCVVISPERHSFFIETVRKRAGLAC